MWRRFSSISDPEARLRELKRHVLRLYKHIHPDRLGRFPQQRATNENSFRILQSAIERYFSRATARNTNIPPQPPQSPQQLTFFAHGPQSPSTSNPAGLKKAVVYMHESTLGNTIFSLFEALDLEPPPNSVMPGGVVDTKGLKFRSLTQLIKHARQVAMHSITKKQRGGMMNRDTNDEVLVTRLMLQRSRGLTIALGSGLPLKLEGPFRRLARTIREIGEVDLRNVVIELDGGFDVSMNCDGVFPYVKLGACATNETWMSILRSEQLCSAALKGQEQARDMQIAEVTAAQLMGVRMVLHDVTLVQPCGSQCSTHGVIKSSHALDNLLAGSYALKKYCDLLGTIERYAKTGKDGVFTDGISSLALMFTEGYGFHADVEQGVLKLGIEDDMETSLATLKAHGKYVNCNYEKKKTEAENEEKTISSVRLALGVPSLRRLQEVSDRDWHKALAKLRTNAGKLQGVLVGTPLVIGTRARLLTESYEVEIPHDYDERLPI